MALIERKFTEVPADVVGRIKPELERIDGVLKLREDPPHRLAHIYEVNTFAGWIETKAKSDSI